MDDLLKKIIIFIDYQNVYKTSQNIFLKNNHIDISKISHKIIKKISFQTKLIEIRVYTGVPSKAIQPKSYWNTMKRFQKWKKDSNIIIQSRNLSYSKLNKESDYFIPREKGIDVLIAVDLVSLAIDRKFDVAIIFSLDTDLKPALEYVKNSQPTAEIFVVAWRNKNSPPRRLSITSNNPVCIWLNENDYLESILN